MATLSILIYRIWMSHYAIWIYFSPLNKYTNNLPHGSIIDLSNTSSKRVDIAKQIFLNISNKMNMGVNSISPLPNKAMRTAYTSTVRPTDCT